MNRLRLVQQDTGRIALFKVDMTEKLVEWAVYLDPHEIDDLKLIVNEFLNPPKEETGK